MRLPPKPPRLSEIINRQNAGEAIVRLMQDAEIQKAVGEINDQYLHWEKVRFRPCPPDVSPEELWYAVKMHRGAGRQQLPLSFATQQRRLSYVSPPKHLELIHHIDKQAGGIIAGTRDSVLADESDRYLYGSLMEEAIASSQLEGASTTRKVAKEMLRANRKPRTTAERMILNNYKAILEVRELKKELLTAEILLHLQKILTEGTLDNADGEGRFRRADEVITVVDRATSEVMHVPPGAAELDWRIKEICDFANSISNPFVHPVIKAAVLHFALGYAHPFVDGNGRTARAIFLWYMLKRDYWLFEFLPISRVLVRAPAQYARAYLYTETDGGDVTYFVRYTLQAVMAAIREFYAYVAREEREAKEAAELLENLPGLNHRQRSLIHDALKNPGITCTISIQQGLHHVTYPTARSDLLGLVRLGLLRKAKAGKALVFRPPDNLRKILHLPPSAPKAEKEKVRQPIAVTVKGSAETAAANSPKDEGPQQRGLFE